MSSIPVTVGTASARNGEVDFPNWLVDSGFVLVLSTIGLFSFRTLYGGWQYLVVGVVGVLLGTLISQTAVRRHMPVLAEVVISVIIFLAVGGGLAARSSALGGVVPTGQTFSQLWHVGIYGWKDLLTTAPPLGDTSNLLAIPFLVGLVGSVVGTSIAMRTRISALPLIGPVMVLSIGILFGSRFPTSLLLQGTVFGGLALAWVMIRYHRYRQVMSGSAFGRHRLALAGGLLIAVGAVAGLLGPVLPGARSHTRVVLSRYVVPPFDVSDLPSPLAGFRQYTQGGQFDNNVLFTVHASGNSVPSQVRIATMDEYDGLVWGFGSAGSGPSIVADDDAFQKYGTTIPAGIAGAPHALSFTVADLGGNFVPEVGDVTQIAFTGPNAGPLNQNVRYDAQTATAAQPVAMKPGERYSLDTVVAPTPSTAEEDAASAGTDHIAITDAPQSVQTDAMQWEGSVTSPWEKVSNIAAHLKQVGKYSNGEESPTLSLPGHSEGRLATFLNGGGLVGTQIVGDDEQYAAAMALMANAVGVPARVVLGADVHNGQVIGSDVHAWIEVELSGLGWVPMYQDQFMSQNKPNETPPTQQPQQQTAAPIQPPAVSAVRSPFDNQLPGTLGNSTSPNTNSGSPLIPSWVWTIARWLVPPILVVALFVASILGIKRRRRNRRRRAGRPSTRIVGAWAELVDLERDFGRSVPSGVTRREQAPYLQLFDGRVLANRADAAVFGPVEPTPDQAEAIWSSVDQAAAGARAKLGPFDRWKATLSLRSLRVPQGSAVT